MWNSRERVASHTPWALTRRLQAEMRRSVARCAASGPEVIDERLTELDFEWDLDRALVVIAPLPIIAGLSLGVLISRRFLLVPAVVAAFLGMYAIRGWSPPVALLRHFGVRTRDEIAEERFALKAVRGDFREIAGIDQVLAHVLA